jgi:hypothetical protein
VAGKPPLHPDEVRRILRKLAPLSQERRIVLIGGQAVAFWAAFFRLENRAEETKLFTSADIDFEGAAQSARRAGELLRADVQIPEIDRHTPNTGLVVFKDSDGVEREMDFLLAPYGLTTRDVRNTAIRLNVAKAGSPEVPVWVMHPERCMESRVHNVVGLKQSGRIAMDQLRHAVVCAKEFSRYLLGDEAVEQAERIRAVLNLNERIFKKCLKVRVFRDVFFEYGVDPFDAVLVDDLLPERFRTRRYPQMVNQLEDRRKRSRAQRDRYAASRRSTTKNDPPA